MAERLQTVCSPCDADVLERIVRLDMDPRARVKSVVPFPAASRNVVVRVDLEGGESLVVKLREGEGLRAFDREAYQLGYLSGRPKLPVPRVLAHRKDGAAGPFTYMILSYLNGDTWASLRSLSLKAHRAEFQRQLGDLLGRLHAEVTGPKYCEVLPNESPSYHTWTGLFASLWEARLDGVVKSARLDSTTLDAVDWIYKNLFIIIDTKDSPRLIHGNLGGTKIICSESPEGLKVSGILDPALCFGHHEVDLALLELSGCVDEGFFEGYRRHLPIQEGYSLRKYVYMLYFMLDKVRRYGNTHHILSAMDCSREILKRYGC